MARSTCPGRKFVRAAPSVDPPSPRLRSHCLHGGTHEDLVERHALRAADGEGDDVGDVARRDGPVEGLLGDPLAGGVGDVVGEFRRGGAGLGDDDPDVGLQLDAQLPPTSR